MFKKISIKTIVLIGIILFVALVSISVLLFRPKPKVFPTVAAPTATSAILPATAIVIPPTATVAPTAKVVTPLPTAPATAGTIATLPGVYDFEDGTTQGWEPRGESKVQVSTDVAQSGTHSLLITDRTINWHGARVNMLGLLEPGSTYEISAYVRLAQGEPASRVILTMERTPVDGEPQYEWIAPSSQNGVTDAEWVFLKGQYSFKGEVSGLYLYLESPDEELVDFYVDNLSIKLLPPDVGLYEYNFEDGTTQGWGPRGDTSVSVVTGVAHSGSHSLLTTNRAGAWQGVTLNVSSMLQPGKAYEISGYVKLAEGEPDSQVKLTMQRKASGESTKYESIAYSSADGVTDTDWVLLKGVYSYSDESSELLLYVESPDTEFVSFYIDDVTIISLSLLPVQTDIPSVYETFANDFLIGAALEGDQVNDERHATLLTHHFNSITAGNAMKPGVIQPAEGDFKWITPDAMVQFAREHDLAVHGHTLVWHQQAAEWMFRDSAGNPLESTPENKALVLKRLEDHIRAVVGRYKEDVNVWDVVNEAIDPAYPDCMRRSRWFELTGTDYIITAFRVAHEIAPDADLIINEYGTTDPPRRLCLYNVVRDLRAQGVQIDGVGHQMHINIDTPTAAAIEETILMFVDLGVTQHITELDMSIYTNDTDSYTTVPEEILIKQGYRYKEIFEVFKRQAEYIDSITFWGLADDQTWLKTWPVVRLNLPLLFDENLRAKYAYWGIIDPSQLPPFIQRLTVPKGTPSIDAVSELQWTLKPWINLQGTETLTASFQTRWDEKNLYLFLKIEGSTQDLKTIEVFVDGNNGKTKTYESDDRHYVFQDGACTACEGVTFVILSDADGYQLEAAFPLSLAGSIGGEVGFDIRLTVGDPGVPISWNDLNQGQEADTSEYGTLKFADADKVAAAAPGTPIIDGEKEAVWDNAVELSTDVWVVGTSGSTAKVLTLWDSQYLYVYAVVTDKLLSKASTNAYEQDSFEVFIDQNNAKTITYQSDDGQYRVNFDNEQSFNGAASADTLISATKIVPGGYVVELAIKLTAITPQEGLLIGFDFQVNNDEDGDGTRDSVVTWNDPTHQSYQNTSRLGILQFAKQAK